MNVPGECHVDCNSMCVKHACTVRPGWRVPDSQRLGSSMTRPADLHWLPSYEFEDQLVAMNLVLLPGTGENRLSVLPFTKDTAR